MGRDLRQHRLPRAEQPHHRRGFDHRACGDRIQEGDIVILDSDWKFPPFTPETNSPADKRSAFVNAENRKLDARPLQSSASASATACPSRTAVEADVKPFHDIIMAYRRRFLEVLKNLNIWRRIRSL